MRIFKYLMLSVLLLTAASCVYDFDPQIEGTGGLLVIEGDILVGDTTLVQVSTVSTFSEGTDVQYLRGADVFVESEDGTLYKALEFYSGQSDLLDDPHYRIDTRAVDVNQRCRLVVKVQSGVDWDDWGLPITTYNEYYSDWVEVQQSTSTLDSIGFYVTDDRSRLDVNVWMHGGTETGYYRWIGREVWEYTSEFHAVVYYDLTDHKILPYENGENYYYCWKRRSPRDIMIASTIGLNEDKLSEYTVFSTDNKEDERYSMVYMLTLVQERLSPEAYAYWLATRRNTSDVGGLMSPQPFDMQGNIRSKSNPDEKVVGFINASTVTRAKKYYRNVEGKFFRSVGNNTVPVILGEKQWARYYSRDYRPIRNWRPPDDDPDQSIRYEWAPRYCVDCRLKGGNKNRPADWPYDHK